MFSTASDRGAGSNPAFARKHLLGSLMELADMQASNSCARKGVWVRVPRGLLLRLVSGHSRHCPHVWAVWALWYHCKDS